MTAAFSTVQILAFRTDFSGDPLLVQLGELLLISTLFLGLIWLTLKVFQRICAASRHRIWLFAFLGLLLLPIALPGLPKWELPVLDQLSNAAAIPNLEESAIRRVEIQQESSMPLERMPSEDYGLAGESDELISSFADNPEDSNLGTDSVLRDQANAENDLSVENDSRGSIEESVSPPSSKTGLPVGALCLIVWFLVASLMMVASLLVSFFTRRSLLANATRIACGSWVENAAGIKKTLGIRRELSLYLSGDATMPATWGVFHPVIVLPAGSECWPGERRQMVLLHELAHVKRLDVFAQTLARLTCVMYWFHPLAWMSLRRMRFECELACDDVVVSIDQKRADYAAELLQIARSLESKAGLMSVNMASSSLERRIREMFNDARSHLPAGRRLTSVAAFSILCLLVCLVSLRVGYRAEAYQEEPLESLPNSKEVIERYIQAIGGELALSTVESLQMIGDLEESNKGGQYESVETFSWSEERWNYSISTWPLKKFVGAEGPRVWYVPKDGKEPARWQAKSNAFWYQQVIDRSFEKPLRWLRDHRSAQVTSREKLEGKDVWVLTFPNFDGQKVVRYFDVESGLLVKSDYQTKWRPMTKTFSDYRDVEGLMIPFSVEGATVDPEFRFSLKVNEVKINTELNNGLFARPENLVDALADLWISGTVRDKQTGLPIPDVEIVVDRIRSSGSKRESITFTDHLGRYRIFDKDSVLRDSDSGTITFAAPVSQAYPETFIELPVGQLKPIVGLDAGLEKGRLVECRVVNSKTGEAVESRSTLWFSKEPRDFRERSVRSRSDSSGRFFVVLKDGVNILHVLAKEYGKFPLNRMGGFFNFDRTFMVDDSFDEDVVTIELVPFPSVEIPVLRRDGTNPENLIVVGDLRHPRGPVDQRIGDISSPIQFYGFEPDENARCLLVWQRSEGIGAGRKIVPGELESTQPVQPLVLQPCARFAGKLVEGTGEYRIHGNWVLSVTTGNHTIVKKRIEASDAFEVNHLLPGLPYTIVAQGVVAHRATGRTKYFSRAMHLDTVSPGQESEFGEITVDDLVCATGVVTDKGTGDPVANASVYTGSRHGPQVTTDETGRFKIFVAGGVPGMSETLPQQLVVDAGRAPWSLTRIPVKTETTGNFEPLVFDIELENSRVVTGQVVNRDTGQPVEATILYRFPPPPGARNGPQKGRPNTSGRPQRFDGKNQVRSAKDGRFKIAVEEQIGKLYVQAEQREAYSLPDPPGGYHAVVEFNLKKSGTANDGLLVELAPATCVTVPVLMPDGQPAKDFFTFGCSPLRKTMNFGSFPVVHFEMGGSPLGEKVTESDETKLYGLDSGEKRLILIVKDDGDRQLGALRIVDPQATELEKQESFHLKPCASANGLISNPNDYIRFHIQLDMPEIPGVSGLKLHDAVTIEADGNFTIRNLLPGLSYKVAISRHELITPRRPATEPLTAETRFKVSEYGEVIELGEIELIKNGER